jgi:hypothetical protein
MSSEELIEQLFSKLEQAAFRGRWDEAARNEFLEATGLKDTEMAHKTQNPYDSRYQKLCVVSSVMTAPTLKGKDYDPVRDYLTRFPESAQNAPPELLRILRIRGR